MQDSIATSKSAWGGWKAELVGELAERSIAYLRGEHEPDPAATFPSIELLELALVGEQVVRIEGNVVTVVTPDRPGVFSRVAGALALHGIDILDANLTTADQMAIDEIRVEGGVALHERPDEVARDIGRALRRELAITCLFISHDLAVIRQLADRVGVMQQGRMVETGPVRQVLESPSHPYTQRLLASVPSLDPDDQPGLFRDTRSMP